MDNLIRSSLLKVLIIVVTVLLSLNFGGGCNICQQAYKNYSDIAVFLKRVYFVTDNGRIVVYQEETNCNVDLDTILHIGSLNAIELNIYTAMICGSNGKIMKGSFDEFYKVWNDIASGTTHNLNDIAFRHSADGPELIIIGDSGTILKSTDEGMTFFSLNSGTTLDLNEVQYISWDSIRVSGDSSLSMYSTDGGDTWIRQTIPFQSDDPLSITFDIKSQHFISFNTGWAAARHFILKTTNAGLTWFTYAKRTQPYNNYSNSIFFYNKDSGIVVGNGGDVQFSTNGGAFWFYDPQLQNFTTKNLNKVIYDRETGFAGIAGDSGITVTADSVLLQPKILLLSTFVQGFYNNETNKMIRDTARVYLRNYSSPYSIADSAKKYSDSLGQAAFSFNHASNGTPYYIVFRHRNSIETWSDSALSFSSNSLSHNFTTSQTQAFGNNMIQVDASPLRFAVFSGDVNQDEFVDLSDIVYVFNEANVFSSGYIKADVTGDDFVDLSDITLTFNNSNAFVNVIKP